MPATRYEILLPRRYNDGSAIEPEKLLLVRQELFERFGALTVDPHPLEGIWTQAGVTFEDVLLKYVVDVSDDTADVQAFFCQYKEVLKDRLRQFDIWIVAYPIRVVWLQRSLTRDSVAEAVPLAVDRRHSKFAKPVPAGL